MSVFPLPSPVYTLCQIVFPTSPDYVALLPNITQRLGKKFPVLTRIPNQFSAGSNSSQFLRWDFNAADGFSGIILQPGGLIFNFMGDMEESKLSEVLDVCKDILSDMKTTAEPCTRIGCRRAYLLNPALPLGDCLRVPEKQLKGLLGKESAYASLLYSFRLRENVAFKVSLSFEDPPQALSFDLRGHSLNESVQASDGEVRLDLDGSSLSPLPVDLDVKAEWLRYLADADEVLQSLLDGEIKA